MASLITRIGDVVTAIGVDIKALYAGKATIAQADVAANTNAATSKATPVDADLIPIIDSASSFSLKKLTWANLKATLKAYFDGIYTTASATSTAISSAFTAAIGTSVQAYDANTAKTNVAQSWTAQQTFKELKDTVHTITDGAAFEIDPGNGSIQTITLGANRTPAATNFEAGQVVLLGIDDGAAYTITWTTVAVTWVKAGGSASAPTLATTGFTWVLLWKVGSTIYGTEVGKP